MRSIHQRRHKVSVADFGRALPPGASAKDVVASMPRLLASDSLRLLAESIGASRAAGAPVVFALGGHVVKAGCSPYIIDLVRRGVVTHLALNGAAAIHDAEIAMCGGTSEDVDEALRRGEFGMAAETMSLFASACRLCAGGGLGLGAALIAELGRLGAPHSDCSLLRAPFGLPAPFARHHVPRVTVHAAIGADTVHMSPDIDGAALGAALMYDFRATCDLVCLLGRGVWVNVGSAALLPEVFLKAVAHALRGGIDLGGMTTADMDMVRHYRTAENVVRRPPGRGVQLTGHHEVMIPLLHQLLVG
jgi:hypothetical protein